MVNNNVEAKVKMFLLCHGVMIPYFFDKCKLEIGYNRAIIGANLIQIGAYLIRMKTIPPQIPLLYSLPIGEDQLVEWWMIFLIPILMNGLYVLNSFIYQKYFHREDFEKAMLRAVNMTVLGICTYLFVRIVFLVS